MFQYLSSVDKTITWIDKQRDRERNNTSDEEIDGGNDESCLLVYFFLSVCLCSIVIAPRLDELLSIWVSVYLLAEADVWYSCLHRCCFFFSLCLLLAMLSSSSVFSSLSSSSIGSSESTVVTDAASCQRYFILRRLATTDQIRLVQPIGRDHCTKYRWTNGFVCWNNIERHHAWHRRATVYQLIIAERMTKNRSRLLSPVYIYPS